MYRVCKIDVYTLWNIISQQRNETEIQFLLCMIQKALEKHSNMFIILHVFKQTWQRNYHSMNVSSYWGAIGTWRMFLSSTMLEGLNVLFENENEVYFQQDGAPPQFHVNVRNFLNCTFNQRWRGQSGSAMEFSPQSQDLTLLDFYLWGTLKDMVYATKPQTLEKQIRLNMPSMIFH